MTNRVKIGKTTASVPGGGASYAPNPQTLAPDPAAPHVTWYLDETGATPGPGYGNNYYSMYVFIGSTPPASPFVGQLWWDSTNIGLFIWYDDGNSQQWVSAVAGVGSGADSALVPGTVTAVSTVGPGITGGPITTTGNLVVQWNAGQVFMLGSGLTLTAGTLNSVVGPDAPSDGYAYGRLNAAWAQVLPLTGGTLSGPLNILRTFTTQPAAGMTPLEQITLNVNWTDSVTQGWFGEQITVTVPGTAASEAPQGNVYPFQALLTGSALRNLGSAAGTSQDSNIISNVTRNLPPGGVPNGRRMRDMFAIWGPFTDNTNLPTSQCGDQISVEFDNNFNHVDDTGGRTLHQINCGLAKALGSGGYPASFNVGSYVNAITGVYGQDHTSCGGAFSHSALNMFYAGAGMATITSATPGAAVRSVTVDNVMWLESGGSSGGPDFPTASTYCYVRTANGATTNSTTVVVNDVSYLQVNMFVYDTLTTSGVPMDGTQITAIAGNTLTLSHTATFANLATIVFSRARKHITIHGNTYIVAGVTLTGAGSTAGTVYFTGNVTIADATNGVTITPNAHAIWLNGSGDSTPWADICFDGSGSGTIRSDGSGGVKITGAGLSLASHLTIGGSGITYAGLGGGHDLGFTWTGAALNAYVDGSNQGSLATQGWVGGAYLPLTGGSVGALSVGGNGIDYAGIGGAAYIGFTWSGSAINGYINGANQGALATQGWVGGGYLPLAGGSIAGAASGWSTFNLGKQLYLGSGGNPALGISDGGGTAPIAIANLGSNTLNFYGMPALANSSTAPTTIASFSPTAASLPGTLTMTGGAIQAVPASGVVMGASGPTIRSGTGAASGTQPSGSIWMRTDGTAGNRMYVSQGGGTWAAIAGV